jgi:predicted RNA-binding Zn-ribbon protein involved in translation (DUF1610 family)
MEVTCASCGCPSTIPIEKEDLYVCPKCGEVSEDYPYTEEILDNWS